jgi:hypothetical protein
MKPLMDRIVKIEFKYLQFLTEEVYRRYCAENCPNPNWAREARNATVAARKALETVATADMEKRHELRMRGGMK